MEAWDTGPRASMATGPRVNRAGFFGSATWFRFRYRIGQSSKFEVRGRRLRRLSQAERILAGASPSPS